MERLTEYRVPKGGMRRKYPCFSPNIIPDDNCPQSVFCEKAKQCNFVHISSRKCPYLQVIDRLAAYEDTGLEPEEIESIKSLCLGGKHYVLGFLPPTNAPLTLEELREMANRKVPARFTPGDTVWVVERDENGNVFEVSGYMFLASVDYFAVVSAFINDVENLDETMALLADDTAENDNTDLCVFPLADVYGTQEAAHAALDAEEAAAGGVSNVSNLDTKEAVP